MEEQTSGHETAALTPTVFETVTEDEFYEHFRPVQNHLDGNACFDGCMFETYGPEREYVAQQAPATIWTVLDTGEGEVIASGYHWVNRIGYLISSVHVPDGLEIEVRLDGGAESDRRCDACASVLDEDDEACAARAASGEPVLCEACLVEERNES